MKTKTYILRLLGTVVVLFSVPNRADEITDWNGYMLHSLLAANTSPLVSSRVSAIVSSAVFDAVNGVERKCDPVHVVPNAASGASRRAAAVEAAYQTLAALFPQPAVQTFLAGNHDASLNAIASDSARENSVSIARGIDWGKTVAHQILAWRATDGFTPPPPPFIGGLAIGEWRPTPPAFLPGAGPQFAYMTTWVLNSQSQFRPPGPPPLTSAAYAADVNETQTMGSIGSLLRTADETTACKFWAASTVTYFWNSLGARLAQERNLTFTEEARFFAQLNIAMADGAIACWDAKYHYVAWRPITAIVLAGLDGNPDTTPDPGWLPLLITPNHPEYPSGHSTVSGAGIQVLAGWFGENTSFWIDSDVLSGVIRNFANFTAARDEIANARIMAGIHFRTACEHGFATGSLVGQYVMQNALQRVHGRGN